MMKLRDAQSILIQTTQDYLRIHQRKRAVDDGPKNSEVTKFSAGDYVLRTYSNRPPNKLAGMYRDPMIKTAIDRPDLVKVRDLITNKESVVHANRLRPFKHPKNMSREQIEALIAADLDEFYVEKIIGHSGVGKTPRNGSFEYAEDDTMLDWAAVKTFAALDEYSKDNLHTNSE